MSLSWTPEWSPNGCIQALLVARSGELSFELRQDGGGYWGLSARKDIPYDKEALAARGREWAKAEAAWASGEPYKAPSLEPIETDVWVGSKSPPNFGRGWTKARAIEWADSICPKFLETEA